MNKSKLLFISLILLITFLNTISFAEHKHSPAGLWSTKKASSHAPIGVMGDHTHHKGEWMMSYRFMQMDMDGNRNNTDRLSAQAVLNNFMVAPLKMDMEMHMLGAMYAPSDNLTLTAMMNFIDLSMEHVTRMGMNFKTNTSGIGDSKIGALYKVYDNHNQRIHLNMAISLPTGDIEQRDNTPIMQNAILPYPMQLGSETYDLLPGITYLAQADDLSFGTQFIGTLRLGENSNDYTLGNKLEASTWVAYDFTDWLSTSLRILYTNLGTIGGQDQRLNPMLVQTANTDLQGGERVDFGLGFNLYKASGNLKGLRLAFEYLIPLYQDLNGPQLETDGSFVLGAQMAF